MDIYPGWLLFAWKLNFFLFRWIWDYPPKITPKPSSQKDWIWVLLFVCLFIVILKDIKKLPLTEVNFTFPVTELTWRWKASPGRYSALSLHAALSHHGGYWLFTSAAHILPLMDGAELVLRLVLYWTSQQVCYIVEGKGILTQDSFSYQPLDFTHKNLHGESASRILNHTEALMWGYGCPKYRVQW